MKFDKIKKILAILFVTVVLLVLICYSIFQVYKNKNFSKTAYMLEQRGFGHTAILMKNNKILISGGCYHICPAEIFDPMTSISKHTGIPSVNRWYNAQSILLDDGRVLFAGGDGDRNNTQIEIFTPETGKFELVAQNNLCTNGFATLTKLNNGNVFITCGNSIIFDPKNNSFGKIKTDYSIQEGSVATLLRDGRVLIAGLIESKVGNIKNLNKQTLIFDPQNNSFKKGPNMEKPRLQTQTFGLPDGEIIFVGGHSGKYGTIRGDGDIRTIEVYNPNENKFETIGFYKEKRSVNPAVFLDDQKIYFPANNVGLVPKCEIFDLQTKKSNYTKLCQSKTKRYTVPIALSDKNVILIGGISNSKNPKNLKEIMTVTYNKY